YLMTSVSNVPVLADTAVSSPGVNDEDVLDAATSPRIPIALKAQVYLRLQARCHSLFPDTLEQSPAVIPYNLETCAYRRAPPAPPRSGPTPARRRFPRIPGGTLPRWSRSRSRACSHRIPWRTRHTPGQPGR